MRRNPIQTVHDLYDAFAPRHPEGLQLIVSGVEIVQSESSTGKRAVTWQLRVDGNAQSHST